MLVWKKILWLRDRIAQQRAWIAKCGGDLAGYIANYGDPGVPPVDQHGTPQTFKLTPEQEAIFDEGYLSPVPGVPGSFYKPHFGDGGTAIYNADKNALERFQAELSDLEIRCYGARQKADEMAGKVKIRE